MDKLTRIRGSMKKKKIKLSNGFLTKLHKLIYDNSNTQIGIIIDIECKEFIKRIEELDFDSNNQ